MRVTRLARIITVALKHGLDEFALGHERTRALRPFVNACFFWRDLSSPRAVRLRQALEDLGPIFMKFGQMLSTRRDLLPADIADELAKLQDRVPPFPSEIAQRVVSEAYGLPLDQVFAKFDANPLAAATIAQVHSAELKDGSEVVVKIVRPGIRPLIERDLEVMYVIADFALKHWPQAPRLK